MLRRIYRYFSKPVRLSALNGLLIAIIIGINIYFQAFCIPTTWTIIVLTICFANTIFYPFLEKTRLSGLSGFVNGVSLMIFIYCIIFLESISLIGLMLVIFGIGLPVLIPPFFIIQLIWKNLVRPANDKARNYFIIAIVLCFGVVIYIGQEYKHEISSMNNFKESKYRVLEKSFMTEKILGMHFIYHTRYCEFDGWRPPKHEPVLIIGMWLNGRHDPLNVHLDTRLALYKKFYPGNKYKFDCSCGMEGSVEYHSDSLWE